MNNPFINPIFSDYYKESPIVLCDIGSSGGIEAIAIWKEVSKYLKIIGSEPDERAPRPSVKTTKIPPLILKTALYHSKITTNLWLTRQPTLSSLLKPNYNFIRQFPVAERFDVINSIQVKTDSLDNQLSENKIDDVDFLKIDTQGTELYILEGGRSILNKSIFGIETEVEFAPLYQEQPLFSDVDTFIRKFGFEIFDLNIGFWKRARGINYGGPKGQLVDANAVYFKSLSALKEMLDQYQNNGRKKSKILRCISICILYGYIDYAEAIFNQWESEFSLEERKAFSIFLNKSVLFSRKLLSFKGRRKIAKLLYYLWLIFRPENKSWNTANGSIGNLE